MKTFALVTLAAALAADLAMAQPAPQMGLTLRQAVDLALSPDGNARAAMAQELIQQAESQKSQARSALLPNIDGEDRFRSFTQNLQAFGIAVNNPIPGFQFPIFVGPVNVNDLRATATQSIFDLSAIRRYNAAKASVTAAQLNNQATRDQVTAQVAKAYVAALRSVATVETAQANLSLGERLVKLARTQKDAGTGLGIEVTRAEVQLANSRQQLIQAEQDRRAARLELLRTIGLNLDADLALNDSLSYQPQDVPAAAQAAEKALAQRAEIKTQGERERSAKLNYDAVNAERLPSIGAFGDYGVIGLIDGAQLPTRTFGVALKIPVFDGGRRDARRGEAMSQLRQEQIRTRDLRQTVDLEVRLSLDALTSAGSQVEVAQEALKLSERELEQAERRYVAGVATNVEVTDAQARLVHARENHVQAQFRYRNARIDLSAALGQVNEILQ